MTDIAQEQTGEVRLMPMRFIPSDEGGFWWPAHAPVDAEGERKGWPDAWEDAITEEEAHQILLTSTDDRGAKARAHTKLRKAFP